jgi:hypothetical protein
MKYKDHHIEVSVRAVGDDPVCWKPDILCRTVNTVKVCLNPPNGSDLCQPNEAEKAGIEFAQKWVDDGKPDLNHDPQKRDTETDK